MTILRVGTNEKYAEGWDTAFGKGKKSTKKQAAKKAPGAAAKSKKSKAGKKAKAVTASASARKPAKKKAGKKKAKK